MYHGKKNPPTAGVCPLPVVRSRVRSIRWTAIKLRKVVPRALFNLRVWIMAEPIGGYINHLTHMISGGKEYQVDVCIVIPCDSIEAWIAAAFDKTDNAEMIENPWESVISKAKSYHDIRDQGRQKKSTHLYGFCRCYLQKLVGCDTDM
mgnify:CR=1 FL=1